ncbi:DegV family protein [Parasporobacterium paucivorans]|uniref:EDD domain protein, DegV family n=1 Tax=Parasporobacterium paucivorans DSM 15970 TaxID=1122934 RepID=A0A1M6JIY2_9FIRM|nr:DegV family protein [Parasporobacterium paucivorans]SHJ46698.1 EDD domain protein, DegV family [Parasporobacterium paucivorans DSM 15970]
MGDKMAEMEKESHLDKIAILIDSGCDVPQDIIEKYNMKVLRLHVIYNEKEYTDGLDITADMVYERFPAEIPTTSTPGIGEITDVIKEIKREGYNKVIAVCISSGLSGTYNAVRFVLSEEDELESFVFDTKNISMGSGFFAIWIAYQIEKGKTFREITEELPSKIKDSKVFFYMDNLDYLRKGGRIGLLTALAGNILNIKPIISCNEQGAYYTVAKERGSKKAMNKLLDVVMQEIGSNQVLAAIMNGAAVEKATQVKERLLDKIPALNILFEKQVMASLAVHTGPGLIGIGIMVI